MSTQTARPAKQRLDHVDAMRPVKQAGVVSTHSLLFFANGALITVGGALMLLHVTREAFLFISACMLTYSYRELTRGSYRRFYQRRALAVVLPYAVWTVVYFFMTMHTISFATPASAFGHLLYLFSSGYYQLYYLIVIMQFYVVYPFLLWLLHKTEGHHVALLLASLALQALMMGLMHWRVVPVDMRDFWGAREITAYQFYLVAGMVAAVHLEDLHRWLWRNGWKVFFATCAAAAVAELWFVAGHDHWASWMGSGSDPFQPIVIPFNIGAIACIYLFGVWLVEPQRSARIRKITKSGSDNAYGIYLAQLVFVLALSWAGVRAWHKTIPWPILCIGVVAVVILGCVLLSSILARTPLAVATTGRKRESWSTWLPEELRPRRDPGLPEREEFASPIDLEHGDGPGQEAERVGAPSAALS